MSCSDDEFDLVSSEEMPLLSHSSESDEEKEEPEILKKWMKSFKKRKKGKGKLRN